MAEPRRIKTRVIQKHAQAAAWTNTNFIPLEGELIVFDKDSSTSYPRLKIGNGKDNINALPFITAGAAEKLVNVTKITLLGAITGEVAFDGSSNPIITTELAGEFKFTGEAESHSHNVDIKNATLSGTFTPTGTITGSYTPEGSISTPEITVNKTTQSIKSLKDVGSYVSPECVFPTLQSTDDAAGTVTLSLTTGSFNAGSYIPPTYEEYNVVTDATASSGAITFNGTSKDIEATFAGNEGDVNVSGDITASSEEITLVPTGTVNYIV